jgi:hypothetical protein
MARNSVRAMWGVRHDLKRHPPNPNGVVPHQTRFVEEAENVCCATRSASQSKALHCRSDICLQRCHDGTNQTAKRSVTRMSDHDPKERRKNELDPKTQLEKPPFARITFYDCSQPNADLPGAPDPKRQLSCPCRDYSHLSDTAATRHCRCPKVFLSAVALAAIVLFWL